MATVRVCVEAEAGSNLRYAYDESTLERLGSRQLPAAYPFPYGFVVGTVTDDGDAVDCYLLTDQPVRAGQLADAEPVGLLEQFEDGVPDHKLLAAPPGEAGTVDPGVRETIERFVREVFRAFPGVKVEVGRLLGADAANRYVATRQSATPDGGERHGPPRPRLDS